MPGGRDHRDLEVASGATAWVAHLESAALVKPGNALPAPIPSDTDRRVVASSAPLQQNPQLQRRLQQDSIELAGKTIYLNPFLYWRRFDANTDRWLREPGQLNEDQITTNRLRFYPEVVWDSLSDEERAIKDGSVEMFLKSLELISTFNPELTAGQLLELERKSETASPPPPLPRECDAQGGHGAVCHYGRGQCMYDDKRGWFCACGGSPRPRSLHPRARASDHALAPDCIEIGDIESTIGHPVA